ncbi:hypothetical protein WICMUC_004544 [Wickerhamomyces mucosus]|uniref:Symplekin/Pta1 N-terminal domain-containing protein n=1 Tax=Wickerhamomyces mucosus TaxID=1378264 RepID=A0A9P8PGZ4_9ASCO|nr:hypothetical protein WICMUC_004544 [Wickerhamomyces mucosus]
MSAEETIAILTQTKSVIFDNPQTFPEIIKVVSNIAESSGFLQVQQWCSQFFNEVFSPENQKIPFYTKQEAANSIIRALINLSKVHDVTVYRNVVLTLTHIYDMLFDLVAKTSNGVLWQQLSDIKNFILSNWNTSYPLKEQDKDSDKFRSIGSKIATAKFISKVIIVQSSPQQTPPSSQQQQHLDPRRRAQQQLQQQKSNTNEICIANLQDNHSVLNKINLEAEGQGLLDLLLNFFQDEEFLVSQVFIAVLNVLVYIIQRRRHVSQKVYQVISEFDYASKYQGPNDSITTYKLHKRFIARATKNALNLCIKSSLITSSNPLNAKFAKMVSNIDAKMAEHKKKGILNIEEKPNKKIDPNNPFPNNSTVIDDNELKSLYQLIANSNDLTNLDASQIPQQTLSNIAIATLVNLDTPKLISALSIVSQRYTDLTNKTNAGIDPGTEEVKNEEEEQLKDDEDNNIMLKQENNEDLETQPGFLLPQPSKFSNDDKKKHLSFIITNFFQLSKLSETDETINSFASNKEALDNSIKISKVAINDWKKNSWLVLLTRLATRGLLNSPTKEETDELSNNEFFSDLIRDAIFNYSLENIHERIDIIIEWLNEEWYSEFTKNSNDNDNDEHVETPIYFKWTEKVLDSLIPFLEANDRKIFIRLLSDLPVLNENLVSKIKSLCTDPQRTTLGLQSLQFLIIYRPPVKSACVNLLKDLNDNYEDLKEKVGPLLVKYGSETA